MSHMIILSIQQFYLKMDYPPLPRRMIPKMQNWKKIFYSMLMAFLCLLITRGDPKRTNLLNEIQITDKKLQYIFETTIAVQTKRIRHRLTQQSDGIWDYISTYVISPRWAEIQVLLKTRIGIRLNSIFYDKLNNNVHIDFGSPEILDRSYTTKILSSSDNFFYSWSIRQFEEHKDSFLKALIDSQSQNLVEIFKADQKRISELQSQYYQKVMSALNYNYNNIAPQILVYKLNQYVIGMLANFIPQNMLQSINSSYFYQKKIDKPTNHTIQSQISNFSKANSQTKTQRKAGQSSKVEAVKNSNNVSIEQRSRRQRMKKQLQL